jgi:hypothetical protein
MKHISFDTLVDKAQEFKQAGLNWHFHMIGPACTFSRLKDQYEIIIEIESTGEEFSSCFSEKPISETRRMAELAYGPGFLNNEKNPGEAIATDGKVYKNEAFQQRGKHCIVFEDETSGDALYAYYDHDPVKDLSELEALFFAK